MKQLKGGGLAFYQPFWRMIFSLMFMVVIGWLFLRQTKDWGSHLLVSCFFLFAFLVIILSARKPVCVLYPERLCINKKSYYWPQLTAYYFQKRMVGQGKHSTARKTLVFESNTQEVFVIELWELLAKEDQQQLLAEIALRGIPQLPEKEPDHWVLKMCNSLKRGEK